MYLLSVLINLMQPCWKKIVVSLKKQHQNTDTRLLICLDEHILPHSTPHSVKTSHVLSKQTERGRDKWESNKPKWCLPVKTPSALTGGGQSVWCICINAHSLIQEATDLKQNPFIQDIRNVNPFNHALKTHHIGSAFPRTLPDTGKADHPSQSTSLR